MRILHAAWGVLSVALAFGINAYMAPRIDRTRDPSELANATGKLVFRHGATTREFPLVTSRPIVEDLVYPFGKRIEVRELSLRAVAAGDDPAIELFVDITATGASAGDGELRPWLRRMLPVVPAGFGGAPLSRVRLAEGAEPVNVVEGALTLSKGLPMGAPEEHAWRVRGEMVLTLLADGELQQATGEVDAKVIW